MAIKENSADRGLTSRCEATRGLFWDGPRNFEPPSDDEDDTSLSKLLHHTLPAGARLTPVRFTALPPREKPFFFFLILLI
ncbi:hypothetical protein AVEN_217287-1 [Araneus ventricosus]|uniref:Uncharacterized protein n=1 Tax=Araneus ventricosus TaxID=182803 RepID=A0A4Y2G2U7_ARAVE|nr:hypothetical protein AVEN_217287-1 [Araneus ventricosus]